MHNNFYSPKYWPAWIVVGLLWLCAQLPYKLLLGLGKCIGLLMYYCSGKLKHIAQVNLNLCFPELNAAARKKLLKDNFIALGISIFESALAWFGSQKKIQRLANFHNLEYLDETKKSGRGLILLGAHFVTLELAGRMAALNRKFAIVYREHKKPFINFLITKVFRRYCDQLIERKNVRAMLKTLKQGGIIWYTPDIDAGYYHNVFVPFFGVLASTITAPARMAQFTNAKVLLTSFYRRDDGTGYDLIGVPAFENFPSGEIEKDITYVNQILEQAIRKKPEQYLWQYKRFKSRPEGEKRFY